MSLVSEATFKEIIFTERHSLMNDVFCDSLCQQQVSEEKHCELALQFPNSPQQHYNNLQGNVGELVA